MTRRGDDHAGAAAHAKRRGADPLGYGRLLGRLDPPASDPTPSRPRAPEGLVSERWIKDIQAYQRVRGRTSSGEARRRGSRSRRGVSIPVRRVDGRAASLHSRITSGSKEDPKPRYESLCEKYKKP